MGCNLVSILFLATTSLLGPVRLGEKVRGMRMMWGIKIRIPITLPSPPLPSPPLPRPRPRPRPCPLFELIKIIAVQARRGDTRRKKELFMSSLPFYSCPRGMKFYTRSWRFWLDLPPARQRQMIIHQYRKKHG